MHTHIHTYINIIMLMAYMYVCQSKPGNTTIYTVGNANSLASNYRKSSAGGLDLALSRQRLGA